MKFNIYRTSDSNFKQKKDFKTLEELIDFKKEIKYPLIIVEDYLDDINQFAIQIYDDYRE